MRTGRERALTAKRREARARVKAWRTWCQTSANALDRGQPFTRQLARMPELPTDNDYRLARP